MSDYDDYRDEDEYEDEYEDDEEEEDSIPRYGPGGAIRSSGPPKPPGGGGLPGRSGINVRPSGVTPPGGSGNRPGTGPIGGGNRPGTGPIGNRPGTGPIGNRPGTGPIGGGNRPGTGPIGDRNKKDDKSGGGGGGIGGRLGGLGKGIGGGNKDNKPARPKGDSGGGGGIGGRLGGLGKGIGGGNKDNKPARPKSGGGGGIGGLKIGGGGKKDNKPAGSKSGGGGGIGGRLGGLGKGIGIGGKKDNKSSPLGGNRPTAPGGNRPTAPGGNRPTMSGGAPGQARQSPFGQQMGTPGSQQSNKPATPKKAGKKSGGGGGLGNRIAAFNLFKKGPESKKARASKAVKVQSEGISLDTKLDILGVLLVLGSLGLIFSALSPTQGAFTGQINDVLSRNFGWGAIAIPIAMLAVGVWLILRHFGDEAPTLDSMRIIGLGILYVGALVLFQFVDSFSYELSPDSSVLDQLRMVWLPISSQAGRGGGWVGAEIYYFLLSNFTEIGGFFLLVAWMTIGVMLTLSLSAAELAIIIISVYRSFSDARRRRARRRAVVLAEKQQQAALALATAQAADVTVEKPQPEALPAARTPSLPATAKAGEAIPATASAAAEVKERSIPIRQGGRTVTASIREGEPVTIESPAGAPVPAEVSGEADTVEKAAAPLGGLAARLGRAMPGGGSKPDEKTTEPPATNGDQKPSRGLLGIGGRRSGKPDSVPEAQPTAATQTGVVQPAAQNGGGDKVVTLGSLINQPTAQAAPSTASPTAASATNGDAAHQPAADKPAEARPAAASLSSSPTLPPRPGALPPRPSASPPSNGDSKAAEADNDADDAEDMANMPPARPKGLLRQPGQASAPSPVRAANVSGDVSWRERLSQQANDRADEESGDESKPDIAAEVKTPAEPKEKPAAKLSPPAMPMPKPPESPESRPTPRIVSMDEDEVEDETPVDEMPALTKKRDLGIKPPPAPSIGAQPAAQQMPERPDGRSEAPKPPAAPPMTPPAPPQFRPARKSWKLPDYTSLLMTGSEQELDHGMLIERARIIEDTLASFGAPGNVVEVRTGPVVTQFGVEPDYLEARGGKKIRVKVSAIAQLDKDLQLALGAKSIRIEAPVPGKGYVGIEVPNEEAAVVRLRDVMESDEFKKLADRPLAFTLGLSVDGTPVAADLATMPHLLIAGTTGSGKSVCVNSIIDGLVLRNTPDKLKFIMVDPKRVELTGYNGIPHLVSPVVVELERIVSVLKWVTREMDERYKKFSSVSARNIEDFNKHLPEGEEFMPYLVVIIDELADLMMLAPDETERVVTRIAALARATGIHLVIATQRPSVDVVTGLIKANFPARIAFAVAGSVDSRVILDQPGAERLLGRGDMLYMSGDSPAPQRLQGVFVSDGEINNITRYWRSQSEPGDVSIGTPTLGNFRAKDDNQKGASEPWENVGANDSRVSQPTEQKAFWDDDMSKAASGSTNGGGATNGADGEDAMYDEAVEMVRKLNKASVSLLQRRLRIGYTRAARLIDLMEERGVVGPATEGSKPRAVLPEK